MRQRLGIATALLGDPEVLILDEPANGLDPAGIRWMRDLLRGYADRGGTVLLSSHLLHEIEVIADDLVVIGHGRIVAQGTKAELLAAAGTLVRSADDRPARAAPLDAAGARRRQPHGDGGLRVDADPEQRRPRSPSPPASPSPSSAPPTAPASRRCSSSSPPTPNAKEQQHDHHHRPRRRPRPSSAAAPHARGIRAASRSPASSPSSCARCSTPGPASGCWRASASRRVLATVGGHPLRPRRRERPTTPSPPRSASRWR